MPTAGCAGCASIAEPQPPTSTKKHNVNGGAKTVTEYKPQTLAGILLANLGTMPLEEIERMEREEAGEAVSSEKLDTVEQITAAIANVTRSMLAGKIKAPDGRAMLYGLQTLLVAKRMQAESQWTEIVVPKLEAAGFDEIMQVLIDLAKETYEDQGEAEHGLEGGR